MAVSLVEMGEQLSLYIGLENGVLLRSVIDSITGSLSDSRQKFLGLDKISLSKVVIKGQKAVLALSSKPFLCYSHMGKHRVTPLSYDQLDQACAFSSTQCF